MSAPSEILSQMPAASSLYLKAAGSARRKPKGKPQIPALSVGMHGMQVDPQHLAAYRDICGFAGGPSLPIIYPQIMAQPLVMHLMTQPAFPLPLLGLVHLRNSIEQIRPLHADEAFDIQVATGESREVRAGLEFDIVNEFKVGEEVIWRALMTVLFRVPGPKGGKSTPPPPEVQLAEYRSFDAPADIGRRYAKVSGDYNPIHLYGLTAKMFGFPRAIAHGLWSMARCCALLQPELHAEPKALTVAFKQPLLLPGKVGLKFLRKGDVLDYQLLSRSSDKVHLTGTLR
jgi:hypothetical protein